MSREKLDIDPKMVTGLAAIGCSVTEIAELVGCHRNTIHNRFCAEIAKGTATLKMKLRRAQVKSALDGNVVMLIWLGKNLLSQCESPQVTDDEDYAIDLTPTGDPPPEIDDPAA